MKEESRCRAPSRYFTLGNCFDLVEQGLAATVANPVDLRASRSREAISTIITYHYVQTTVPGYLSEELLVRLGVGLSQIQVVRESASGVLCRRPEV